MTKEQYIDTMTNGERVGTRKIGSEHTFCRNVKASISESDDERCLSPH